MCEIVTNLLTYKNSFLKLYLSMHTYFYHFRQTFFICSGGILQLHLKWVYINQTMHNTWVYLSKNYIAFTGFEIAWYRPHRRQKMHIPLSKAFALYFVCAYYLLDILEIRLLWMAFTNKKKRKYKFISVLLAYSTCLNLLLALSNSTNLSVATISCSVFTGKTVRPSSVFEYLTHQRTS